MAKWILPCFENINICDIYNLPNGKPHLAPELIEWCKETFGYIPELIWSETGWGCGIGFQNQKDMVLFHIREPHVSIFFGDFNEF